MKKLKLTIVFVLVFSIIISTAALCFSESALAYTDPDAQASAVMLVETKTGQVLYSKNETEKISPASVTKIMTVLLAVEACEKGSISENDIVTATAADFYDLDEDGSTLDIQDGEQMTLLDLMYGALVASANEACNIIAHYVSGDISTFIDLMNTRAGELGCVNTHFNNAHGLPDANHYSCANDLYLIMNEALKHPLFAKIAGTATYKIGETNKSDPRYLTNTDKLILSDSDYYYPNAYAGKTGYTEDAGYCLASAAKNDELSLIAIVMGTQPSDSETGDVDAMRFTETTRLYDWAFSSFAFKTVTSKGDIITQVPVLLGDGTDHVILTPDKDITALLDNDLTNDDLTYDVKVFSTENGEDVYAPVNAGDVLGEMTVSYNGRELGTCSLVASTSVALKHIEYLKMQIKETLSSTWVKLIFTLFVLLVAAYIVYVVNYNKRRKRKKELAAKAALQRTEELKRIRKRRLTTGKDLEDIIEEYREDDNKK